MMNDQGYPTYHEERLLLEALKYSGEFVIPDELIKNAYFENYNTSNELCNRLPHCMKLQKTLKAAYGEPIFVKIDNIVNERSIGAAIDELRRRIST